MSISWDEYNKALGRDANWRPGQTQQPQQPQQPQPQPQTYNPYGQPQQPTQQPYNPYGQPQQPQQPYNPYGQPQQPTQQPYNPYGQPQQPTQQPYNPYTPPQLNSTEQMFVQSFQTQWAACLNNCDLNRDGNIDKNELIQILVRSNTPYNTAQESVNKIFQVLDKDNNGVINARDIYPQQQPQSQLPQSYNPPQQPTYNQYGGVGKIPRDVNQVSYARIRMKRSSKETDPSQAPTYDLNNLQTIQSEYQAAVLMELSSLQDKKVPLPAVLFQSVTHNEVILNLPAPFTTWECFPAAVYLEFLKSYNVPQGAEQNYEIQTKSGISSTVEVHADISASVSGGIFALEASTEIKTGVSSSETVSREVTRTFSRKLGPGSYTDWQTVVLFAFECVLPKKAPGRNRDLTLDEVNTLMRLRDTHYNTFFTFTTDDTNRIFFFVPVFRNDSFLMNFSAQHYAPVNLEDLVAKMIESPEQIKKWNPSHY